MIDLEQEMFARGVNNFFVVVRPLRFIKCMQAHARAPPFTPFVHTQTQTHAHITRTPTYTRTHNTHIHPHTCATLFSEYPDLGARDENRVLHHPSIFVRADILLVPCTAVPVL